MGAILPGFKHEFVFRCSFLGLNCIKMVVFRNVATRTHL